MGKSYWMLLSNSSIKQLKQQEKWWIIKSLKKIVKPKLDPEANSRNVEEIVIPPEKRQEIINELRQLL